MSSQDGARCIPGNASSTPSPYVAHCSQAVLARGLTLEAPSVPIPGAGVRS